MIVVAGHKMEQLTDFSDAFAMITGIIADAEEWLTWALSVPAGHFWLSVRTEGELLSRMLEGLHGTSLLMLNQKGQELWIHPVKLMDLGSSKNLPKLEKIINGEKGYKQILKNLGLMTLDDLTTGFRFLDSLGVSDALVFQIMTLADQIKIVQLRQETEKGGIDEPLQKEAADFAVKNAQTPAEFCAGFRFYLAAQKKGADGPQSTEARQQKAVDAWSVLSPLCNPLLETFVFKRDAYWETLADSIKACLLNGFRLGFLSKPAAMCNIMRNSAYTCQKSAEAKTIIAEYLTCVRETVEKGELKTIRLSQDGLTRSYVFSKSGACASVAVDAWGIVTLTSCMSVTMQ